MLRFISGLSIAKQSAKPTPTKTTVEAVEAMNGTLASPKRSSLRNCKEQPTGTPENKHGSYNTPKHVTRTSPRKRKESPTEAPKPGKRGRLSRVSTRATVDAMDETFVPQNTSSSKPFSKEQRPNMYDHPKEDEPVQEEIAPRPKKQKALNKKSTKSRFEGFAGIDLPAQELIVSSSPMQSTRSNDKTRKVKGGQPAVAEGNKKAALSHKQSTKPFRNKLAQAAEHIEEANTAVEHKVVEPPMALRRGSSSKGTEKESVAQPTPEDIAATSNSQTKTAKNESPAAEEDDDEDEDKTEQSMDETVTDGPIDSAQTRGKERAKTKITVEERMSATSGVEDAISLYECSDAWTRVWVNAKKAKQNSRSAKSNRIRDVIGIISRLKAAYNTISQAETSAEEAEEAEMAITVETKQLQRLQVSIAAVESDHHGLAFVEQIHEQIVPRMSTLMKNVLAARYDKEAKDLPINSLEELVKLMQVTSGFRGVAEQAKNKPKDLLNERGSLVLGLAREAMASLKIIKKKYSSVVDTHHDVTRRTEGARRREAEIAREERRIAALHRQKQHERNEAYQRKLREERERKAIAARRLKEELAEAERQWKQALMTNNSLEAERLRQKFGLGYWHVDSRPEAASVRDTVFNVDDLEVDSDFEPVNPRSTRNRPNGVHSAHPRPRREPTEDIPAPSGEQKWTDQQIEALVWGLRTFRGRNRYQNILHAPEVNGLLRGRSDLDLMQQALYIKQSMARAMETGVLPSGEPLEDDWTWLRSVPG